MARVKRGVTSKAKHKKVLKAVKGQWGRRKNTIRVAKQAMERLCSMLIEIDEIKKENLNHCGSKELMLALEPKV